MKKRPKPEAVYKEESELSALLDYLERIPQNFWGTIEVMFKKGKPVLIQEHRQIKLNVDDKHEESIRN